MTVDSFDSKMKQLSDYLFHEEPAGQIYNGDVFDVLPLMESESVDCVVTSPPYWGLRDYGVEGQIGLEKTPEEYVEKIVQIFREVRRILKKDGALWLNLGDSYVSAKSRKSSIEQTISGKYRGETINGNRPDQKGHPYLKDKDLCMIPARVALALQVDGWWLRQDIIWHKPNPMPESVTDRCTKSHEYIFLLTKSAKYYFDYKAIKEKSIDPESINGCRKRNKSQGYLTGGKNLMQNFHKLEGKIYKNRNKRSVWTIPSASYKDAHFATFPPDLIIPCIKTTRPGAVICDIFFGSGTVGEVAKKFSRHFIGIELNPDYCKMSLKRLQQEILL